MERETTFGRTFTIGTVGASDGSGDGPEGSVPSMLLRNRGLGSSFTATNILDICFIGKSRKTTPQRSSGFTLCSAQGVDVGSDEDKTNST
mmetsp:Transcript_16474/g.27913  ORF Transcript_16474/g.27913 Transcript_16474/m.27913 type:complete len:90 (+) Transcript_16474:198-467(+)